MIKILKYLIFVFCISFSNIASSQENIYYIDMDFIMNNSLAGKSIEKQLEKKINSLNSFFEKTEKNFQKEETKLIAQKNILEKKDFDEKVNLFKNNVIKYRSERSESMNKYAVEKNDARKRLLEKLMPIVVDYSSDNSISFILPKQSIIIGKSEFDITQNIIEVLNKKIKSIKLN
tara:strand:+ start:2288 stop:2812 length:525 start_codon:yes stop_codon:yes gene_type:complete